MKSIFNVFSKLKNIDFIILNAETTTHINRYVV